MPGRKPHPLPPPAPAIDGDLVAADLAVHDQLVAEDDARDRQVRLVASHLGYSLPADCLDPDLIQRDIAANMRRSVEAVLEVGRGLYVLKQLCEHGQFLARLDVLGIEPRVGQRLMQSAFKFSNASTSTLLKAVGNQSKLFEFLVLDDEQLDELTLTGQTGELSLDDVATMSVKQLRAALREARSNQAATEQLLADKNRKIDALARDQVKPRSIPQPTVADQVAGVADELSGLGDVVDAGLAQHLTAIAAAESLIQAGTEADIPLVGAFVLRIGDQVARICTMAANLRDEYDTRLAGYVAMTKTHTLSD